MMTNIQIEVFGVNEMIAALQATGQELPTLMAGALSQLGYTTAEVMAESMPEATGALKASVESQEGLLTVLVTPKATNDVGAPYAGYVESGRGSGGMPPYAAIERWANIKLGSSPYALVRAIQKNIAARGVVPNPFIENTLTVVEDLILETMTTLNSTVAGILLT